MFRDTVLVSFEGLSVEIRVLGGNDLHVVLEHLFADGAERGRERERTREGKGLRERLRERVRN